MRTGTARPAQSFREVLLKMRVECLEFELGQLRGVARGLLGAIPTDRAKWWLQLKVLVDGRDPGA